MNVNRLGQRLQREVKANPKKAAVLGLLGLVAVWFWGPLVKGWVAPDDQAAAVATSPTPGQPVPPGVPQPGVESGPPGKPRASWEQLVEWMERDPRTLPQAEMPGRPNPFRPVEAELAKVENKKRAGQDASVKEVPTLDPESLGLSVTSTIIGPIRRVALISGKAYQLGENVNLSTEHGSVAFRLVDVSADGIVLEREGKRFDLNLPKSQLSGRIEVLVGTEQQTP